MNVVEQVQRLWKSKYNSTPWTNQELKLIPGRDFPSTTFQIIVDCHPESIDVKLDLKQSANELLMNSAVENPYSLRIDPLSSSIYIDLNYVQCDDIKAIRIKKKNTNFDINHLVLLKHEESSDQWVVQHNTMETDKALLRELDRVLQFSKDPKKIDLLKFINFLTVKNFNAAVGVFENSPHLKPVKNYLQWFTERFGYQLNAHGIKKTFKFWSQSEKKSYLQSSSQMIGALSTLSPHVCLGFGAVLGFYRDNDLILHDDDIDILVAFDISEVESLGAALALVERQLIKLQFEIVGRFFSHLWVKSTEGRMIDIFVGLIEPENKLSFYPSPRHSLLVSDIFPSCKHELCGVMLPFPKDCLNYLVKTYGPHWEKPDINFQHAWNRSEYLDIAGKREHPMMFTRGEANRRNTGEQVK